MARYPYNTEVTPPAAFVRLTLTNASTGTRLEDVPAQIDSGADFTVLSPTHVEALGLVSDKTLDVMDYKGIPNEVPLCLVSLAVEGVERTVSVEAVASGGWDYVLLGLDALRHFTVLLDGPNQLLDIE